MIFPLRKRRFVTEGLPLDTLFHRKKQKAAGLNRGIALAWYLRQKRLWCVLLLPLSFLFSQAAAHFPAVTEMFYSRGIYPVFSAAMGFFSSLLPRSITEAMIVWLPIWFFCYLGRSIYQMLRQKAMRKQTALRLVSTILCIFSCTIFTFTVFCGLNYSRETFAESNGLIIAPSSVEELQELCVELVAEANTLRAHLPENTEGVMVSGFANADCVAGYAQSTYGNTAQQYPSLAGFTVRPKPVYFSDVMSHLNITGIYMPFFFEANVNVDVPAYSIPATMMHEISHFKGYMREEEANFIAYLVCRESGNDEFAYSGTMLALQHSLNALYKADQERYRQVILLLSDAVQRDRMDNRAYWQQFEGPVASVSAQVNDVYLKTNRQTEGVRSYGQVVDLLLAEHRQNFYVK